MHTMFFFFFSSRRRHTRLTCDWSSDVCSSDLTTDMAERGANAGMFSAIKDFSPAERERLDAFLDMTYSGFKAHVAAGRHLSEEQVEAVAKGRVWSGEEA